MSHRSVMVPSTTFNGHLHTLLFHPHLDCYAGVITVSNTISNLLSLSYLLANSPRGREGHTCTRHSMHVKRSGQPQASALSSHPVGSGKELRPSGLEARPLPTGPYCQFQFIFLIPLSLVSKTYQY